MSKNFQISYIIEAVDKASATINSVEKRLNSMNKSFESSNKKMSKSSTAAANDYKKMALVYVKSDSAIEKARKLKLNEFVKDAKAEEALENKRISLANQRQKAADKEVLDAQRLVNRKLKEEQRFAKEQVKIRNQNISTGSSTARTSMAYITAPTVASAALSLRNTMTIEQLKIRLLTQFGEEGNTVFKETSKYALETAFSMRDAVGLVTDLKIGASNIGVKNTNELINMSKSIGNTLLAFTSNREDRQEIVNQLGQVAMAGQASFRQDILVMNRRGLPIIQAIEEFTGIKYKALQDKYGANLPAKLVYDALINLSKSEKIVNAMALRSESLTQSWDSLAESMFFFSSDYGNVLSQKFNLTDKFKTAAGLLQEMSTELQLEGKLTKGLAQNMVAFGTALAIATPPLVVASFLLQKMLISAGGLALVSRRFLAISGIVSLIHLTTLDWKTVIEDIDKQGFKGMLKHMDILIEGALAFAGIMAIAIPGGAKIRAALGLGAVAGAYVAYNKYKGLRNEIDSENYMTDLENTKQSSKVLGNKDYLSLLMPEKEKTMTPAPQDIKFIIQNVTTVDKSGYGKTDTKVKRSYDQNPITNNLWNK